MDKRKNFETSVPEDYVLVKHVDAKSNKKTMTVYTVLSVVPLLLWLPVMTAIARRTVSEDWLFDINIVVMLVFCAVMMGYIVLHELVHGLTYKYFTGAKLTFGLTLTVAFCGVPDIYVRKKASLTAVVMPFAVFNVVFLAATVGLWFVSTVYGALASIVFMIHLGGCVGDLHWVLMYLTTFRNCNTLMRDTGPEQWLYMPKQEALKYNIAVPDQN